MSQLHETRMGQQFIDSTMPRIADSLEKLVKEMKLANELKREELGYKNKERAGKKNGE